VWLSLTAVPTFTHRLAIPDLTFGTLLDAHKTGTGCSLGHSHRALVSIYVTGSHTTAIPTYILTTLLKGLTLLQEVKREISEAFTHSEQQ